MYRVQIAGVRDAAEARLLVEEGVDDLGFPLGPGVRTPDCSRAAAAEIVRALAPPVAAVLITYHGRADDVLRLCDEVGAGKVQLHGDIELGEIRRLKALRPGLFVIKSLVVGSDDVEALAVASAPYVDAFLTDTFDPATGARGATGRRHDWNVSRRLVEALARPVILAGGLDADNVAQAIRQVRPAGVDAHTGVEGSDGRKDRARVRRFVAEARAAFRESDGG